MTITPTESPRLANRAERRVYQALVEQLQPNDLVTTLTSRTPTGCSATSSHCESCGSRTSRSPDSDCSATPSDARWNRNSSRPAA